MNTSKYLVTLRFLALCLILSLYGLPNSHAARSQATKRYMRFISASMKFNPNYIANCSAWVSNGTLNLEFFNLKDVVKGFRTSIDLQLRLPDSKHYQTLFASEIDICNILDSLYRMNIAQNWIKTLLRFSNIKQNCPIEPGYYYVHGLIIDATGIPLYLGSGDYRVLTQHYYGKLKSKRKIILAHFRSDIKLTGMEN